MNEVEVRGARALRDAEAEGVESRGVEILILLARRKWWIAGVSIVSAAVSAVIALTLPSMYTAEATFFPPRSPQSATGALLGNRAIPGVTSPNAGPDLYAAMIKSATLADRVSQRVRTRHPADSDLESLRRNCQSTRVRVDRSGLIHVEAEASDPALAADLANGFVAELQALLDEFVRSDAAQRRTSYTRLLARAHDDLGVEEQRFRERISSLGMVAVGAQARGTAETVARLRAELAANQIELGALRAHATNRAADVLRVGQKLRTIREEIARVESIAAGPAPASPVRPSRDFDGLQSAETLRQVHRDEATMDLKRKLVEGAAIDEFMGWPSIELMDEAKPADRASGPARAAIVLQTATVAFLVAAFAVLLMDLLGARAPPTT